MIDLLYGPHRVTLVCNFFAIDHVLGALAIYGVLAFSILKDQLIN